MSDLQPGLLHVGSSTTTISAISPKAHLVLSLHRSFTQNWNTLFHVSHP